MVWKCLWCVEFNIRDDRKNCRHCGAPRNAADTTWTANAASGNALSSASGNASSTARGNAARAAYAGTASNGRANGNAAKSNAASATKSNDEIIVIDSDSESEADKKPSATTINRNAVAHGKKDDDAIIIDSDSEESALGDGEGVIEIDGQLGRKKAESMGAQPERKKRRTVTLSPTGKDDGNGHAAGFSSTDSGMDVGMDAAINASMSGRRKSGDTMDMVVKGHSSDMAMTGASKPGAGNSGSSSGMLIDASGPGTLKSNGGYGPWDRKSGASMAMNMASASGAEKGDSLDIGSGPSASKPGAGNSNSSSGMSTGDDWMGMTASREALKSESTSEESSNRPRKSNDLMDMLAEVSGPGQSNDSSVGGKSDDSNGMASTSGKGGIVGMANASGSASKSGALKSDDSLSVANPYDAIEEALERLKQDPSDASAAATLLKNVNSCLADHTRRVFPWTGKTTGGSMTKEQMELYGLIYVITGALGNAWTTIHDRGLMPGGVNKMSIQNRLTPSTGMKAKKFQPIIEAVTPARNAIMLMSAAEKKLEVLKVEAKIVLKQKKVLDSFFSPVSIADKAYRAAEDAITGVKFSALSSSANGFAATSRQNTTFDGEVVVDPVLLQLIAENSPKVCVTNLPNSKGRALLRAALDAIQGGGILWDRLAVPQRKGILAAVEKKQTIFEYNPTTQKYHYQNYLMHVVNGWFHDKKKQINFAKMREESRESCPFDELDMTDPAVYVAGKTDSAGSKVLDQFVAKFGEEFLSKDTTRERNGEIVNIASAKFTTWAMQPDGNGNCVLREGDDKRHAIRTLLRSRAETAAMLAGAKIDPADVGEYDYIIVQRGQRGGSQSKRSDSEGRAKMVELVEVHVPLYRTGSSALVIQGVSSLWKDMGGRVLYQTADGKLHAFPENQWARHIDQLFRSRCESVEESADEEKLKVDLEKIDKDESILPEDKAAAKQKVRRASNPYRTCLVYNIRVKFQNRFNGHEGRWPTVDEVPELLGCELELFAATIVIGQLDELVEGILSGQTHLDHATSLEGCGLRARASVDGRKEEDPAVTRKKKWHHSNYKLLEASLNKGKGGARGDDKKRVWDDKVDGGRWVETCDTKAGDEEIMEKRIAFLRTNNSRFYKNYKN